MANVHKFQQPVRVGVKASDPTGEQGLIYYNSTDNVFRIRDDAGYATIADRSFLSSTSSGEGASQIGIFDTAASFTSTDVEGALAELYTLASAGGSSTFADNLFRVQDNGDASKEIEFSLGGATASTKMTLVSSQTANRSLTLPNTTDTLVALALAQTLTNKTIDADSNTITNIENADIKAGAAIDAAKIHDGSVSNTEYGYLDGVTSAIQTQLNAKQTTTLTDGNILVGNASNVATSVNPSGDVDVSNAGVFSISAGVIVNADINASAAIDAAKIHDGSVSNTEYGYLDGVTSSIQTQITARALDSAVIKKDGSVAFTADQSMGGFKLTNLAAPAINGDALRFNQLGANNGIATLDGGGKVPVSQLPSSIMTYEGVWNATTNSPALSDGTGDAGQVYRVSVAGSQNLGSGSISFDVGDYAIYNSSGTWEKSDTTDAVASVNGQTGIVVLDADDIAEGTNVYFTDERAQDAIGAMVADSSKVSLTYVDGTPSLTADIIAGSLVNADINASAAIDAAKIHNGSVSNTEFAYLDGVTSAIQTQLNAKVTGPASATDNAIARYDSTTGKLLQDSTSILSDAGGMTIADLWRRGDGNLTNYVEEEYNHSQTLTASTTAVASAFTFDSTVVKAITIEYTILSGNERRVGKIMVVGDNLVSVASGATSLTDEMSETDDVGVTWTAALNGGDVELSYTTSAGAKTMRSDIKRYLA